MESKRSEGKDDDDDRSGNFLVEELVKFTNNSNYVEKVQDFMQRNCTGFESYHDRLKSGEGNKLEWMDLFREYLEIVDGELEKFCEQHDAVPSDVFAAIERYLSASADEEFIPLFLKTINEDYFFEQMYSFAREHSREDEVIDTLQNEEKGESSMSGIYHHVPESIDVDDLNNWLSVLGLPWPFKKLFMAAHKKPMKNTIIHVPKLKFEICIKIPFFGNVVYDVKLDGKWGTVKDRAGKPMQIRGEEQDNGDVTLHVKDRGGGLMMIFLSMTGPDTFRMHREYYCNGVDSGSPNADAVLRCSFRK